MFENDEKWWFAMIFIITLNLVLWSPEISQLIMENEEKDEDLICDVNNTYLLANGTYAYSFEHPEDHKFYCVIENAWLCWIYHENQTSEKTTTEGFFEITNQTNGQLQNVAKGTIIELWAKNGTNIGSIVMIPVFYQFNSTETTQND